MATFLFNETVFGPIYSRRLGISLGINLLPNNSKVCNFNCIYCECGLTKSSSINKDFPSRNWIKNELKKKLIDFSKTKKHIDTLTFAGNGEPTLHPEFSTIINDTIEIKNKYYPKIKIAVLSNATLIGDPLISKALLKIDFNILKLDSVLPESQKLLNCPLGEFNLQDIISNLLAFDGRLIIQTLFVKGYYKGTYIDNSIEEELLPWLETIKKINPELVMIYTIARDTPINRLEKADEKTLYQISDRLKDFGIEASVFY